MGRVAPVVCQAKAEPGELVAPRAAIQTARRLQDRRAHLAIRAKRTSTTGWRGGKGPMAGMAPTELSGSTST